MEQISGLVQFRGLSGFAHISLLTDMQFSNLADLRLLLSPVSGT